MFLCVCDCGSTKPLAGANLRSGRTRSCGCFGNERRREVHTTHGFSASDTYQAWAGMIKRCYDSRDRAFKYYGAKGIDVCDKWRSFDGFLSDMGQKPSKAHSVGRLRNDVGYEPNNCRWETADQQANNKSTSVFLEHNGETRTVSQWAKLFGINPFLIYRRLRRGWTAERALLEPRNAKFVSFSSRSHESRTSTI
jgi:hypothetical protein